MQNRLDTKENPDQYGTLKSHSRGDDAVMFTMRLLALVCLTTAFVSTGANVRHLTDKTVSPCPLPCQCRWADHVETVSIFCHDSSSDAVWLPAETSKMELVNVTTRYLTAENIVPTNSDSEIVSIVYERSGIERINETAFFNLHSLVTLSLSGNKLNALTENLFNNQIHLEELDLSRNRLYSMSSKAYSNCNVLKVLDLSSNNISVIEDESLNPSLIILLLGDNYLTNIPNKPFSELKHLETLNLTNNKLHTLGEDIFQRLNSLRTLDLESNSITVLPKEVFRGLSNLRVLNISKNPLSSLDSQLLKTNTELNVLDLTETDISEIAAGLIVGLKRLLVLNASHNHRLRRIEDFMLSSINHLKYIDIRKNNLTVIPIFISHLAVVEKLQLEGNPWVCGCRSVWFATWLENNPHAVDTSLTCNKDENMIDSLRTLSCLAPQPLQNSSEQVLEFRSTAVLTCLFSGEPAPSITWVTPSGYVFHHYPDTNTTDIFSSHHRIHLYNLEPVEETRVRVLSNGSIEISDLLRQDAGLYSCIAMNPLGNATSHILVTLDRETFFHIKIMGIMAGVASVLAVLILTAIGHVIIWLCKKCGLIEERNKQLMQLRENIELYKSQQLETLRENYTQQVHKIKENCAMQVEWIRDSYKGQVKHISDFKHYGSHQLGSMRDQYYDQVKKVRDYSTSQLGWVRENYVFQRNRIQKFGSHQVLRFRENYKYQQQALTKLLENLPSLNLDNCRSSSGCQSEASVYDEPDLVDTIDEYAKASVDEMTKLSVLDEFDIESVYYTPSELSQSPLSPSKDFLKGRGHRTEIGEPGPSHWQDSPIHVFHRSQLGMQGEPDEEFLMPRTLPTSTSLPEMPQLFEEDCVQSPKETAL